MTKSIQAIAGLLLTMTLLSSCGAEKDPGQESGSHAQNPTRSPRFRQLPAAESGIDFLNSLTETEEINYFKWMYLYNGGGVAVGDLNNDGLGDLYFTGNQVPNKLYLNQGGLKFRDVTSQAGVAGSNWSTGVTMADVNGDGLLDIYVVRGGPFLDDVWDRTNLLFINKGPGPDGIPTFTESGEQWQCHDGAFGTHATFFDYDLDGDLDLYVVNHPYQFGAKIPWRHPRHFQPENFESDRLFRNEGDHFTDVTDVSGIKRFAFGLSAIAGDFNGDGYPDMYVANDFSEPDFMFINQKDGTFRDRLQEMTPHISNFSMGSDVGDFNNDGLPDLVVLDMMAENNRRKKTNMSGMDIASFHMSVDIGFYYQYMQNTLLMNHGNGWFTDVAQLAGVSTTDWSWAPLLADFDNDGWQDLYVTNGYRRDARDNDYTKKALKLGEKVYENFQQSLGWMPEEKLANYMYRNNGSRPGENVPGFNNVASDWGLNQLTWSNGAAYADLDNDGDLDLVVSNLMDVASVYENKSQEIDPKHWLRLRLQGTAKNLHGIGATVEVWQNGKLSQWRQVTPSRGYQSSVEPEVHFGLGENGKVDMLYIHWPDGQWQSLANPEVDRVLQVKYQPNDQKPPQKAPEPLFQQESKFVNYWFKKEKPFDDFQKEILLPHKMSQLGPVPILREANGKLGNWLYIGGSADNWDMGYEENQWGRFEARKPFSMMEKTSKSEVIGGCFFDANGDGADDLYLVCGSNEFPEGDARYQDRLFLAEGCCFRGEGNLPQMHTSTGVARAADFDGDGDQDLFVGGRQTPGKYPFPARSYLLRNNGKAQFTDVTAEIAPGLVQPGMITDALWADIDGDGDQDLLTSGEWMAISLWRNDGGKFTDISAEAGLAAHTGWWFNLSAADLDGDGDLDLVGGNMGLNTKFPATPEHPFEIYCHDFDGSGSLDIVLGYYNDGQVYPVRGRTCTSQQMPSIKEQFPTYKEFATSNLRDIYGDKLDSALHYSATTLASAIFINEGGKFTMRPLPSDAQLSAVNAIAIRDFDGDGHLDILTAGNMHHTEVETSRADAGVGCFLKGDGQGGFRAIPARESGFFAPGDIKGMVVIDHKDHYSIIATVNNGSPLGWTVKKKTPPGT